MILHLTFAFKVIIMPTKAVTTLFHHFFLQFLHIAENYKKCLTSQLQDPLSCAFRKHSQLLICITMVKNVMKCSTQDITAWFFYIFWSIDFKLGTLREIIKVKQNDKTKQIRITISKPDPSGKKIAFGLSQIRFV